MATNTDSERTHFSPIIIMDAEKEPLITLVCYVLGKSILHPVQVSLSNTVGGLKEIIHEKMVGVVFASHTVDELKEMIDQKQTVAVSAANLNLWKVGN